MKRRNINVVDRKKRLTYILLKETLVKNFWFFARNLHKMMSFMFNIWNAKDNKQATVTIFIWCNGPLDNSLYKFLPCYYFSSHFLHCIHNLLNYQLFGAMLSRKISMTLGKMQLGSREKFNIICVEMVGSCLLNLQNIKYPTN